MVTKLLKKSFQSKLGFILAKNHMVTKRKVENDEPPTLFYSSKKSYGNKTNRSG